MKKIYILPLIILLLILIVTTIFLSYFGIFFFTEKFNEFDYLILEILGSTLLVGIVTHISSKNISTFISKKDFSRNNKINIAINKSRTSMINYKDFMNSYENSDTFFAIEENDRKILDKFYSLYDYLLNTFPCTGLEKQLMDTILNIPFVFYYYEDENIIDCYNDIIDKFNTEKNFANLPLITQILRDNNLKDLEHFSNIIFNFQKYEITNLNNIEGCQLLITADKIVACKIACLPNHTYSLFSYYNSDRWIDFTAFSFDYDSKEYATNIYGIKYTNNEENFSPAEINLTDFIDIK